MSRDAHQTISGQKSVSTAGVAQKIISEVGLVKEIVIIAEEGNAGNIYLGSSSVDSSKGLILPAGKKIRLGLNNLKNLYIDCDNDGEGVSFFASV